MTMLPPDEQRQLYQQSKAWEPETKTQFFNVKKVIARVIRDGGTPSDVAKRAAEMYDGANAKALAKYGYKTACKIGCAHCCCVPVQVSKEEVALAVDAIKARFSKQEIAILKERMATAIALRAEDHRPRCPLLGEDEACTIYESRPIGCRMCNSPDVEPCKVYELQGGEFQRQSFTLSHLYATYTQLASYLERNPGKGPNSIPSELELLAELIKAL